MCLGIRGPACEPAICTRPRASSPTSWDFGAFTKGFVQFELPSGQLFEVFASESRYYQFHHCPVVGFQVEDVRAARQELESKGIEFMTEVFGDEKEAWAYFRGPDGYLYEIWQTQRPLKAPLRSP